MLTPITKDAGLKQTEIGLVPDDWEVVQLGSIAKIGNGATPKRDNAAYWKGGTIPWLTSGKIHEGRITKPDQHVTNTAKSESANHEARLSRMNVVEMLASFVQRRYRRLNEAAKSADASRARFRRAQPGWMS